MPAARNQTFHYALRSEVAIHVKSLRIKFPRELDDRGFGYRERARMKNLADLEVLEIMFRRHMDDQLRIKEHFVHVEILHQRAVWNLPHVVEALGVGTANHVRLVRGKTERIFALSKSPGGVGIEWGRT